MAKTTHVTTSAMPKRPGREGEKSIKLTAASPRLPRDVSGQNKTGLGKPHP